MAKQEQDDQLEHTYSSYVRIQDVVLKTCRRRWTIGRSGERKSGISVFAAQHDDDDIRGGGDLKTMLLSTESTDTEIIIDSFILMSYQRVVVYSVSRG